MSNIETAAKATIKAYAAAVAQGADPSPAARSQLVSSMHKFYLPGWTSFTLGSILSFKDDEATIAVLEAMHTRFDDMGIGCDIRLEDEKVTVISDQSAICLLTWSMHPPEEASWKFTIAYGFRKVVGRPDGLEGGWEWVNADQEYEQLLIRNPRLFG